MRERIRASFWGSVTLALLYVITIGAAGARARTIRCQQLVDHGVRVISCDSPSYLDDSAIGRWQLITLNLESQGWMGNATLTLSWAEAGEWTAPVVLRAGRVTAAEIATPTSATYPDFAFALKDGKNTLAAGLLNLTPPAAAKGYEEYGGYRGYPGEGTGSPGPAAAPIPAPYQFAASSCLEIAGPRPILPGTIPLKEMECLGARVGFLDNVCLIIVPFSSSADHWRRLPGIDFWLRTGGVLVQTHRPDARLAKRGEKWTRVGAGGIVDCPGIPDLNYLHRITAAQAVAAGPYQISLTPDLFPESDAPLAALAALLSIYLFLALPINYLILRKFRRRELSWVTIPAISVVFAALVIGACYGAKGDSTIVARVSAVQEWAPGVYTAQGLDAIFAPKAARYNTVFPPESLPEGPTAHEGEKFWPNNWDEPQPIHLQVNEGAPATAHDIEVPQWCSRLLTYSFIPRISGAITGTVSYSPRGGWRVTAHNGSSLALEDCRARMADVGWIRIGAIPPGATVSASGPALRLPDAPGNGGASLQSRLRYQTRPSWPGPPLLLIAWTRTPMQSTRIRGGARYLDQTMVLAPLQLIAGPDGLWSGPRMYLPATSDPILCPLQTRRSGEKVYQLGGVVLPAAVRTRPHAVLQLRMSASNPTAAGLWDPRRGMWRPIGRIERNRTLTLDLQNPAALAVDLPGPGREPVVFVRGAGSESQQSGFSVWGQMQGHVAAGSAAP